MWWVDLSGLGSWKLIAGGGIWVKAKEEKEKSEKGVGVGGEK